MAQDSLSRSDIANIEQAYGLCQCEMPSDNADLVHFKNALINLHV